MILLDTHVLVWFVSNPEKLSKKAQDLIEKEIQTRRQLLVSSISIWEIYILIKKERLRLAIDVDLWIEKIEQSSIFQFVPVDNQIAAKAVELNNKFHEDPADRIIVATALIHEAKLITSDKKIINSKEVQTIW